MKILVTGSKGQLGCEINKISIKYNFDWIFLDKSEFNLKILKDINILLDNYNPNIIINCAAYTDVDKAENDFESANIVNHLAVKIIAKWCNNNSSKLIHISTDYIFDGKIKRPIKEDDKTNPLNNYGKTKLAGEIACCSQHPDSIIIRTSWLYSSFANNFLKNMIHLMQQKKQIHVNDDQIGSPTYAGDLAQVILDIINYVPWKPGIYNYTNEAKISWYDFAKHIKEIYGFKCVILDNKSNVYVSKVKRPKYSILDNSKITSTFNINLKGYRKSLNKCVKILKNEM